MIPTTLNEAVDQILAQMTAADKRAYAKGAEENAGVLLHHGTGTALRNDWGLWFDKTGISRHLRKHRIVHGDDRSATIFKALWRRLHDLPIDDTWLAEQAAFYEKFWNKSGLTWDQKPIPGHVEPSSRTLFVKR